MGIDNRKGAKQMTIEARRINRTSFWRQPGASQTHDVFSAVASELLLEELHNCAWCVLGRKKAKISCHQAIIRDSCVMPLVSCAIIIPGTGMSYWYSHTGTSTHNAHVLATSGMLFTIPLPRALSCGGVKTYCETQ